MKYRFNTLFAAARCVISALALFFVGYNSLSGQTIYGLSNNRLISFRASLPGALLSNVAISGVDADMPLMAMDVRPATGELYAMGYASATGMARLYVLDTKTGKATPIGMAPIALKANMGKIGLDFNPTVDRIRVTGSDNSNYRLHPTTGALVATDGNLAFAATDRNAGKNPSIGAVAYTNSYIGATATTLYNFDDSLNILTTQIPPNNGTLNTVGSVGIQVNPKVQNTDIDIYFDPISNTNKAFMSANNHVSLANFSRLYSLSLTTGRANLIGFIGPNLRVDDIAIQIDRTVPPQLKGTLAYALSSTNNLVSFDTENPRIIRNAVPVTGIATGQNLVGLDSRPATGELFGMGYNPTSGEARLYQINPATGMATPIGMAPLALKANMGNIGFDFNPTVDRIRVTGGDGSNLRLHPVTGALAATDANLAFAMTDANAGKTPSIGAVAYINSRKGATTTVLYNYDDVLNVLTTQNPPNNGVLNTVGSSEITINSADPSGDMDIFFQKTTGKNIAYLTANTGSSANDDFFTIDLTTGKTAKVGSIGYGIAIRDLAIAIDTSGNALRVAGVDDRTDAPSLVQSALPLRVFPNPIQGTATVEFELNDAASVDCWLMDVTGRRLKAIFQGELPAGIHTQRWESGDQIPGVYVVGVWVNGQKVSTKKVSVVR